MQFLTSVWVLSLAPAALGQVIDTNEILAFCDFCWHLNGVAMNKDEETAAITEIGFRLENKSEKNDGPVVAIDLTRCLGFDGKSGDLVAKEKYGFARNEWCRSARWLDYYSGHFEQSCHSCEYETDDMAFAALYAAPSIKCTCASEGGNEVESRIVINGEPSFTLGNVEPLLTVLL